MEPCIGALKIFLRDTFSLSHDQAGPVDAIQSIEKKHEPLTSRPE